MSMPQRPRDGQLANIIDKLAEFVARNGPEFENMTKIKQQNNAKFSFLYHGSEFNNYYNYRVTEERRNLLGMHQQSQNANMIQSAPPNAIWSNNTNQQQQQQAPPANVNLTTQIEVINAQQLKLRDQILQSEKNLQAQHQVLLQQQKTQIEDAIANAQNEMLKRMALENQVSLIELEDILQPIIESCTKDSISNGKLWILQQTSNSAKSQIISQYILKKAMSTGAAFTHKLHLIYLINDLLHYCVRKSADDLKNCLESVVIPMFCNATISASEDQKEKLAKLLTLWASKANFFDSCAISKLQSPPSSLSEYQNSLLSQYAAVITPLTQATKATFDNYQQQHQAFVQHATNQIAILETQKQQLEQQQSLKVQQPPPLIPELSQNPQQMIPSLLNSVNMMVSQNRNDVGMMQNMYNNQNFQNQPPQSNFQLPQQAQDMNSQFQNFNLPPPNFPIPDLSRPPPGFNSEENSPPQIEQPPPLVQEEVSLQPTLPFFELPAGLMAPLIRLEDYNYHGIDPELIRLPPPTPPTDKLLTAIEAFYSAPSHERPRDAEGWEKLGLYEYFKVKNAVRKQKEDEIARDERDKSKSPSPIPESLTKPLKRQKKRVYRSKSPDSRSPSRSKSRSMSPPEPKMIPARIREDFRSRRRSRTPSPPHRTYVREPRNDRRKRSVTPPSFLAAVPNKATEFIDEGNKGHQMLKKLGWTSGGLGLQPGITQPISGGEIRDKSDLYKGVGMSSDPYENFRKNRSNNFITRMKSRGNDERN